MASGVSVADECLTAYDEVKMGHRWLYIIYRISDDLKTIVVEERGGHDKNYNDFVAKMKEAEAKRQCRSPDTATIKQKMLYTSSKQALRTRMRGIQAEIQCTDDSDLIMSNVLERVCSKYT